MKKILTIFVTIVFSLVMTFMLAQAFFLYRFGNKITLTTFIYLLFIFCFITYILLSIVYIINKKVKKEKIGIKKIISLLLFFIALILILLFIMLLNLDWVTYYSNGYSSPFYLFVIVRSLEFLLPAVILIIIGVVLWLKSAKKGKK